MLEKLQETISTGISSTLTESGDNTNLYQAFTISEGMEFLHESKVVHGSLSSENVLVDTHGRAKLTGFGASLVALMKLSNL